MLMSRVGRVVQLLNRIVDCRQAFQTSMIMLKHFKLPGLSVESTWFPGNKKAFMEIFKDELDDLQTKPQNENENENDTDKAGNPSFDEYVKFMAAQKK